MRSEKDGIGLLAKLELYKWDEVIISGDKFAHRILRYLIKYRKQIWMIY